MNAVTDSHNDICSWISCCNANLRRIIEHVLLDWKFEGKVKEFVQWYTKSEKVLIQYLIYDLQPELKISSGQFKESISDYF